MGLLTILVGALIVTACGGGSEPRATVVAIDLVDEAGEVTYVVGSAPPETVQVSVTCAQKVAVGESIPSCVQNTLSAQFDAVVATVSERVVYRDNPHGVLFVIGKDMAPGRYRTTSLGTYCNWKRLSSLGGEYEETLEWEYVEWGGSALVDILPTDAGFQSYGCGAWTSDLSPVTLSRTGPFGDGTYLVGVDISPGTWSAEGDFQCSWTRLTGFSGDDDEIIESYDGAPANGSPETAIVSIDAKDVGFTTSGCGSWTAFFE